MDDESRQSLRRALSGAVADYGAGRRELERRSGEPPAPGDVYVFAEPVEWMGEWAVVDRDAEDSERLLWVPADTTPLEGSADVRIPGGAAAGPLHLRCRFGVWLRPDELDPGRKRTAVLEPEHLAQARRKCAGVAEGNLAGLPLEREVDASPEYRDWERAVSVACAALRAKAVPAPGVAKGKRKPPGNLLFPAFPGGRRVSGPLGLAASILLAVALGFAGGRLGESARIAELKRAVERSQEAREELRAQAREKAREVEEVTRELTRTQEARDGLERRASTLEEEKKTAERRAAALEKALREDPRHQPQLNLPFVHFTREEPVRGSGDPLIVPSSASRLALVLEVADPTPFPKYRLQIVERGSGIEVWSTDALARTANELGLDLPRSILSTGDYVLRVYGLAADAAKPLAEYGLSLRLESSE